MAGTIAPGPAPRQPCYISWVNPPLLVCDFDGTLTNVDVGDALCDEFAGPGWIEIDRMWLRGELDLPEAQRRMWALVRATPEDLIGHARRVGALRAGAEQLFEAARTGRIELVLASGGFDLYIEALLGPHRACLSGAHYNRLVATDGGGVRPEFAAGVGCARCAVCKARVVGAVRSPGRPVAFCGDGSSDRCAAGVADRIFAVEGGVLARHCNDGGIDHVPFTDLETVLEALLSAPA